MPLVPSPSGHRCMSRRTYSSQTRWRDPRPASGLSCVLHELCIKSTTSQCHRREACQGTRGFGNFEWFDDFPSRRQATEAHPFHAAQTHSSCNNRQHNRQVRTVELKKHSGRRFLPSSLLTCTRNVLLGTSREGFRSGLFKRFIIT